MLSYFGKLLIFLGVLLIATGVLLLFAPKIPYLGKLPGDILIQRKNFTFFFPLGTCVLISIIISLVLYLLSMLK